MGLTLARKLFAKIGGLIMEINSLKNPPTTPYYIIDEELVIKNLECLKRVKTATGCRILLAQKAFSMYSLYPLIGSYLDGTAASGLFEAKLGYEEMRLENHIFSPSYFESDFDEITDICGHIIFNSFAQAEKFKDKALAKDCKIGLRINPEFSTQHNGLYDPCGDGSRLGITQIQFEGQQLDGISGFHFHTLCEQNSDDLEATLDVIEGKFGKYLYDLEWVNFGGGHHITRDDYDIDRLIRLINDFQQKYQVQVYLEPGEAVVLNTGFLVSSVIDIVKNDIEIAILDTSAACHMPDVIEMPYRPNIIGTAKKNEKGYSYRLGGPTCLAGDIIGDYSFDSPLKIGDKLVFCDMAHYTMVKNNTFNGINLPSIAIKKTDGSVEVIKKFGYADFKNRLS